MAGLASIERVVRHQEREGYSTAASRHSIDDFCRRLPARAQRRIWEARLPAGNAHVPERLRKAHVAHLDRAGEQYARGMCGMRGCEAEASEGLLPL